MTGFSTLGLSQPLLNALALGKYTQPTPIQSQAIPPVLAGRDLLGIAQTGTGKTAAFALPILHRLGANNRRPAPKTCRVLVLSPTRELASQIADKFRSYGRELKLTTATVFGGVGMYPQVQTLARGVDILVATPGRLIDHLQQNTLRLDQVEVVVFDEADQMLDMGFMPAVKRIAALLPKQRQSLFFSATMPQNIAQLASSFLNDPVRVEVTPVATTAERVDQQVIFVETERKRAILAEIMKDPAITRALVFTRTKHGADRVAKHLTGGGVPANTIHGNKSQSQRERALADFKAGRIRVLVATDIAARGIDITAVSHVINFELPNVPESYVHRIGRTARAGAAGQALSLCAQDERPYLRDIERVTRQRIPAADRRGDTALAAASAAEPKDIRPPREPQNHHRGQRNEGHRGENHRGGHGQPQPARSGKPGNRRFGKPRNQRSGQGNPGRSQAQAG